MKNILMFCPTYTSNGLDMFWPDSQASFDAVLTPKGVKITRKVGRDNPFDHSVHRYRNVLHQYQAAQKMALDGGYDALLCFESDVIAPADGLIKLWDTPADLVYGLFVLRHGSNVVNAFRFLEGSPNIDQSLSLFPELYEAGEKAGFLRVSGCGMGFTLIRRAVLERFPFHEVDTNNYAPDWALASDCQRAGVEQVVRFDVKCGHIEDNGVILWPGADNANMLKVQVHQDFVGNNGRGSHQFKAGTEDEVAGASVSDFVRAGFVSLIETGDHQTVATPRKAAV